MGHTNIWKYLIKIGPVNMAQANVRIFLVQFLIQSILDQKCNPNRRQIAMPSVHQLGFVPYVSGPVLPIAQTGPSTTGPETEFLKKDKIF